MTDQAVPIQDPATPPKTKIPAPLYAAAGAGELAYQQLRKLPAVVTELRGKATAGTTDLRHRAVEAGADLRQRAAARLKAANEAAAEWRERATNNELDLEYLREAARRNANAVLAGAQVAQARATEVYHQLVAHGEKVVGTGVVQAADTVNADMEATEAVELPATPATQAVSATAAAPAAPAVGPTKATKAAKAANAAKAPAKRTGPAAGK